MKCAIIPSPLGGLKECLIIPEDSSLIGLPTAIQNKFKNGEIWKVIDINPEDKRIALDAMAACEAIESQGFYIAGATTDFEEIT